MIESSPLLAQMNSLPLKWAKISAQEEFICQH